MQANFLTNQYEFSHGHTPRGRGGWLFEVTCQSAGQKACLLNPQFHGVVRAEESPYKSEDVILAPVGSCTYVEAKARVKGFLRQHFTVADVTVCS